MRRLRADRKGVAGASAELIEAIIRLVKAIRVDAAEASDVFGWIAAGKLKVRVFRELPLAKAGEAHRLLESRQTTGKLLLIP